MAQNNLLIYNRSIKSWERVIYLNALTVVLFSFYPIYYANFCTLSGWYLDLLNVIVLTIIAIKFISIIRTSKLLDSVKLLPVLEYSIPVLPPQVIKDYIKVNHRGMYWTYLMKAKYFNVLYKSDILGYTLSIYHCFCNILECNKYIYYANNVTSGSKDGIPCTATIYYLSKSDDNITVLDIHTNQSLSNK